MAEKQVNTLAEEGKTGGSKELENMYAKDEVQELFGLAAGIKVLAVALEEIQVDTLGVAYLLNALAVRAEKAATIIEKKTSPADSLPLLEISGALCSLSECFDGIAMIAPSTSPPYEGFGMGVSVMLRRLCPEICTLAERLNDEDCVSFAA